jgi:glycosyltransferase involved in cell wall biosynthesis
MNVLHISTSDQLGGAARAAYRLHAGLQKIGIHSRMFVGEKLSSEDSVIKYQPPTAPWYRLRREIRRRFLQRSLNGYEMKAPAGFKNFSDDRSIHGNDPWRHLPPHGLLHLHWVAGFVDCPAFFSSIPPSTPVVWTLHDMNPFTGGCHYDEDCGKFAASCGACPQLNSVDEGDLSQRILQRKQKAFAPVHPKRLHIVADSNWLASEARKSSAFAGLPISAIHYGLDLETFAPRNKFAAREVLGIPPDARVVLFGADHISVERKGFAHLLQALDQFPKDTTPFLLSMGNGTPSIPDRFPHLHLGFISGDRFLSIVYSAADVFAIPSLQEAFGQTALESMACGTPVVGFNVGGIREVVLDGVTGLLAPVRDSCALQQAIGKLLTNASLRAELASNCRRIAVEQYSLEIQARQYLDLYRGLLH